MAAGLDRLDHRRLLTGLCDDAAIFPPGNMPLPDAVRAHLAHRRAAYSDLVGPLVVALTDLTALAEVSAGLPAKSLDVAVTVPSPAHVREAVGTVGGIPAARLAALEVVVPSSLHTSAVVPMLSEALGDPADLRVYVEVPRDGHRDELLRELAGSPYLAKFRTGGLTADHYPDEKELAEAIVSAVRHGVPFKATAGLHHAVRNTDPATGFEQHGFVNLLVATDAALAGAGAPEVAALLAERRGHLLAHRLRGIAPRAREMFRSFGTCVVDEPLTELAALGLLDRDLVRGLR